MEYSIRNAQLVDIQYMVKLSEQKRLRYQQYQPTFWRNAKHSRKVQRSYFEEIISKEECIALVYEKGRKVVGFIIAILHRAPPVYDPGGMTCTIDDFCVEKQQDWSSIGITLLQEVALRAKKRDAVQLVVVCGHLDQSKRDMLASDDFSIASEWYVRKI